MSNEIPYDQLDQVLMERFKEEANEWASDNNHLILDSEADDIAHRMARIVAAQAVQVPDSEPFDMYGHLMAGTDAIHDDDTFNTWEACATLADELYRKHCLAAQAVQVPEIPEGWRLDELNWFEYDGEYGESNSQGYIVVLEGPIGERVEGEALEWLNALAAAIEQAKGGAE